MKFLVCAFTLFVLAGTAVCQSSLEKEIPAKRQFNHKEHVETHFDKSKNETLVRLLFNNLKGTDENKIDIVFIYTYPGNTPMVGPIGIGINPVSINRSLLLAENLRAHLDGRLYYLGNIAKRKETLLAAPGRFHLKYKLALLTPPQTLMKMVNATTLELILGDAKFPLSDSQQEALRDFASRMRQ